MQSIHQIMIRVHLESMALKTSLGMRFQESVPQARALKLYLPPTTFATSLAPFPLTFKVTLALLDTYLQNASPAIKGFASLLRTLNFHVAERHVSGHSWMEIFLLSLAASSPCHHHERATAQASISRQLRTFQRQALMLLHFATTPQTCSLFQLHKDTRRLHSFGFTNKLPHTSACLHLHPEVQSSLNLCILALQAPFKQKDKKALQRS
eukprot:4004058-Karenia_brevis.AAC.1